MIKVTDDNIREIVYDRIVENPLADLNDLDISEVTDLSCLFYFCDFKGDVSRWDTSKVINMCNMFRGSAFDGDIGCWDTSSVVDMRYMFYANERFNHDISGWVISDECNYVGIYENSIYDKILPKGMDIRIAYGDSYDKIFKQKIDKTIETL